MTRAQEPVAEHVARHVADADDGERRGVGVDPHRAEVRLHRDPRTPRGDAHLLVVEPGRAARRERVAQPVAVLGGERVGDVGERAGPLVGRHDEVGIVAVVADDSRRRHDPAVDQGVGEIEQPPDEGAVAGLDRGPDRGAVRCRREPLHHEPALRADRHDDRVLHRLGLHQPEDLGAEVLAPVGPADAAAGDVAGAQVHALDRRRRHPDLVVRTRRGEELERRGVELHREVRPRLVRVRAHDGRDEMPQRAQDPVGVETRDRVDGASHVGVELLDPRRRRAGDRDRVARGTARPSGARRSGFATSVSAR